MDRNMLNPFKLGRLFLSAITLVSFLISGSIMAQEGTEMNPETKPTIVLVHGAFADSSSWEGVTRLLLAEGYPVIAAANPLRGLQSDADYVANILNSIEGPVVLVGHSYGGMVISNAVQNNDNVQALVYIDAFAPDAGESAFALSTLFPGSTLGDALAPVALPDGLTDLYIQPEKFHTQFAADVPEDETRWMAATQRPVTDAALNEVSGEPAWKTIPSWFIYGDADLNIPPAVIEFMAERADAWETVVVEGGSHVVMISHPDAVANLIKKAATEVELHFDAAG
jgi:pimeloyl-ACP methyl ester carboxylesterase